MSIEGHGGDFGWVIEIDMIEIGKFLDIAIEVYGFTGFSDGVPEMFFDDIDGEALNGPLFIR